MENLSGDDLIKLINAVFPARPEDRHLAILVDIPRDLSLDNDDWKLRRTIAQSWFDAIKERAAEMGLWGIQLVAYPDVDSNNADLPEYATTISTGLPKTADELRNYGERISFEKIFNETQLFLAPTEYSTTAPMKNAAKKFLFRAATMPGFSPKMLPALRIDYTEVNRRVLAIKEKLDDAVWADVHFAVDARHHYKMFFDLRFRKAHASSGRFPDQGVAGNLPSGETYIVPYEGELEEKSKSEGTLPVQFKDDIVLFDIKGNRAVNAEGEGESVKIEKDHLKREPAYGNMAELGFGILSDFGLEPIGEILLDEKLGFHIAFGRSDHFGGDVGPGDFSSPREVIHLDQIYIPATQPRILVRSIVLGYTDKRTEKIFKNGKYLIFPG